jgi:hypothetical protein
MRPMTTQAPFQFLSVLERGLKTSMCDSAITSRSRCKLTSLGDVVEAQETGKHKGHRGAHQQLQQPCSPASVRVDKRTEIVASRWKCRGTSFFAASWRTMELMGCNVGDSLPAALK